MLQRLQFASREVAQYLQTGCPPNRKEDTMEQSLFAKDYPLYRNDVAPKRHALVEFARQVPNSPGHDDRNDLPPRHLPDRTQHGKSDFMLMELQSDTVQQVNSILKATGKWIAPRCTHVGNAGGRVRYSHRIPGHPHARGR